LVSFVVIWYIFPRFGKLYQEKSGIPDAPVCQMSYDQTSVLSQPPSSTRMRMLLLSGELFWKRFSDKTFILMFGKIKCGQSLLLAFLFVIEYLSTSLSPQIRDSMGNTNLHWRTFVPTTCMCCFITFSNLSMVYIYICVCVCTYTFWYVCMLDCPLMMN
jgi:hypothetical protein